MQTQQILTTTITADGLLLVVTPDSTDFQDMDICFGGFINWLNENDGFFTILEKPKKYETLIPGHVITPHCGVISYKTMYGWMTGTMSNLTMERPLNELLIEYIDDAGLAWEEKDGSVDSAQAEAWADFVAAQKL